MNIEAILSTICMVIVMIGCAERLNHSNEADGHCAKWGYSITGGGALGCALEWWLARGADWHMDTLLAIGLALVALASLRAPIRQWLARRRAQQ